MYWLACLFISCSPKAAISPGQEISQKSAQVGKLPTDLGQGTGDLDTLLQRRLIRIAVTYSKTEYYVVKGAQRGIAYETGKALEDFVNRRYPPKSKHLRIHVVFLPVRRDKLLPNVVDGSADVAIGSITITPERQKLVDFSDPAIRGISEIAVTGPQSPKLDSLDDLAGQEVFLRRSSSYWEHAERLNQEFRRENKKDVVLRAVPEDLEDEDLLEMVNAGLLPTIIVDDYLAKLWSNLLPRLVLHSEMAVNTGGTFGWAIRKNSPLLLAVVNDFIKTHGEATAFGNQMIRQYTRSPEKLRQAVSPSGIEGFHHTVAAFRKYSAQYDMDYLLMMAKGYQESRLNQAARSATGAIGIMQLMPATGAAMNVGDIRKEEPNIHAGVKYFHSTLTRLYGNEPTDELNKVLFTLAAYNCGPDRVRRLRKQAAESGLDPNVWFDNVELVAAAQVGSETVRHVSNVYKYYVSYSLIATQEEDRRKARQSMEHAVSDR